MNFLHPKAYLIRGDSVDEPWIVLTLNDTYKSAPRRFLSTGVMLTLGALMFGIAVPISAYNLLSSRGTAALLATAYQGAAQNTVTFALPDVQPSSPSPELTGTFGAIGETTFAPAISAAGSNPVVRIESLGINMPIIEGDGEKALYKGAWRSPWNSTPDQGGNTVLFGHRFLNLPPSKNTLFRLNEIEVGDTFEVDWEGKTYTYAVSEIKIVEPSDVSVLGQTDKPTITLITCTPKFTTLQRLVVHATRI